MNTFYIQSPHHIYGSDKIYSGRVFDAVDKNTGKTFKYDITSDIDAFENAKSVPIKTILDEVVS